MTPNSEVQVFRYPSYWIFEFMPLRLILCLAGTYALCRAVIEACNFHFLLFWTIVISFYSLTALLIYWEKLWCGRIELTDATLTRYFGNGTYVTLAWNDIIYSVAKSSFQKRWRLQLTSEAGKHKFAIPSTVENFSELQDIISSRATRSFKDSKRGQLSIS